MLKETKLYGYKLYMKLWYRIQGLACLQVVKKFHWKLNVFVFG